MTILVVTAVHQETDAVVRNLGTATSVTVGGHDGCHVETPAGPVDVVHGGVGPVAAATVTAGALATGAYDVVISAGIAGGFRDRVGLGEIVVAHTAMAADLGCRTDEGFLDLYDLGLAQDSGLTFHDWWQWRDRLAAAGLPVTTGAVLTMSCMTGTDDEAAALEARHPEAVAEAMEGWGVAWPAHRHAGVRCGEIRTVSNVIGRRDTSAWDIAGAFDALARAFAALLAEPL